MTEPVKSSGVSPPKAGDSWGEALAYPLGCLGAIIGCAVGVVLVHFLLKIALIGMVIVAPLGALGARMLANISMKRTDVILGVMAAVIGLVASLWAEWFFFPFTADGSLPYFVTHVGQVQVRDLVLIGVGAIVAFFVAWRK